MTNLPQTISDKVKLWELCEVDTPLREMLEKEFRRFSKEENDISKEELFKLSFLDNQRITAYFLPLSDSYSKYGSIITLVNVEMTDNEKEEFYNAVRQGCKTKGKMQFHAIVGTPPIYSIVEIDTKDIYKIEPYKN